MTVVITASDWKVMEPDQDVVKGAAPQQERDLAQYTGESYWKK